ncbi:unnamed protein product [Closterium sp. Yama58-4]|nr:unnamed protein product [Closterium sp. Yama58-4]
MGATGGRVAYTGMLQCMRSIVREQGVKGLYRGVVPSCAKMMPAAGISFMCYEVLKRVLIEDEKAGRGEKAGAGKAMEGKPEAMAEKNSADLAFLRDVFAQEVLVWSKLRHKNICEFVGAIIGGQESYDLTSTVEDHQGQLRVGRNLCCLVLEFLPGGTLKQLLAKQSKKKKRLPLKRALHLALQVAEGLRYLHARNIVHRDLKTDNLLLDQKLRVVKIADFGVSRVEPGDCSMKRRTGTFGYMAPEVLKEQPYDHKADVYSYGVVLWEIVTCGNPFLFEGLKPEQVCCMVNQGLRPDVPSWCPPALADLMRRCWHHMPARRPDMSEVVERLRVLTLQCAPAVLWSDPLTFHAFPFSGISRLSRHVRPPFPARSPSARPDCALHALKLPFAGGGDEERTRQSGVSGGAAAGLVENLPAGGVERESRTLVGGQFTRRDSTFPTTRAAAAEEQREPRGRSEAEVAAMEARVEEVRKQVETEREGREAAETQQARLKAEVAAMEARVGALSEQAEAERESREAAEAQQGRLEARGGAAEAALLLQHPWHHLLRRPKRPSAMAPMASPGPLPSLLLPLALLKTLCAEEAAVLAQQALDLRAALQAAEAESRRAAATTAAAERERDELRREVDEVRAVQMGEVQLLQRERDEARREVEEARAVHLGAVQLLQRERDELRREVDEARREMDELTLLQMKEVQTLQRERDEARRKLEEARREMNEVRSLRLEEAQQVQRERDEVSRERDVVRREVEEARRKLDEVGLLRMEEVQTLQRERNEARRALEEVRREMNEVRSRQLKEGQAVQRERDEARQERDELRRELVEVRRELDEVRTLQMEEAQVLQRERDEARRERDELRREVEELRREQQQQQQQHERGESRSGSNTPQVFVDLRSLHLPSLDAARSSSRSSVVARADGTGTVGTEGKRGMGGESKREFAAAETAAEVCGLLKAAAAAVAAAGGNRQASSDAQALLAQAQVILSNVRDSESFGSSNATSHLVTPSSSSSFGLPLSSSCSSPSSLKDAARLAARAERERLVRRLEETEARWERSQNELRRCLEEKEELKKELSAVLGRVMEERREWAERRERERRKSGEVMVMMGVVERGREEAERRRRDAERRCEWMERRLREAGRRLEERGLGEGVGMGMGVGAKVEVSGKVEGEGGKLVGKGKGREGNEVSVRGGGEGECEGGGGEREVETVVREGERKLHQGGGGAGWAAPAMAAAAAGRRAATRARAEPRGAGFSVGPAKEPALPPRVSPPSGPALSGPPPSRLPCIANALSLFLRV